MEKLFVYGTLKKNSVLINLINKIPKKTKFVLNDYKIIQNIYENKYPKIIYEVGSRANGFILEVSEKELNVLDEYEGVFYSRKKILVNKEFLQVYL